MGDLYWKYMKLERCMECFNEIQIDQKMILIYKDDVGEYWVHDGECYSCYSKSLTDPEEVKRGTIIGLCGYCVKPVRQGDEFEVMRIESAVADSNVFVTTIPQKNVIGLIHKKCADDE